LRRNRNSEAELSKAFDLAAFFSRSEAPFFQKSRSGPPYEIVKLNVRMNQ
jgi:hypothetical protein